MNAKKNKNKPKPNKPSNPQPKVENPEVLDKPEALVDIKENVDVSKIDERVPEIVSEVVAPILEAKVSEEDTPKKPKRNRGKKKKPDKEDDFEDKEQKLISSGEKVIVDTTELKDVDITEEEAALTSEITPLARRKKNKKQPEQSTEKADQEIRIVPIKKGDDLSDVKIITCVPVDMSEDTKSSKKKNKKKKRTDSERSDKQEEVISCTAAFQKLLEYKDEKTEIQKETKPVEETVPVKQTSKEETAQPDLSLLISTAQTDTKVVEIKDVTKDEGGKGKKKNKKDKKHPQKEEKEDELQQAVQIPSEIKTETAIEDKPSTITGKNIEVGIESFIKLDSSKEEEKKGIVAETSLNEPEKSPKPKAKISKPVEKKRKGKTDTSSIEENLVDKSTEILPEIFEIERKEEIKPIDSDTAKPNETSIKKVFADAGNTKVTAEPPINIDEIETVDKPEIKQVRIVQSQPLVPEKIDITEGVMGKKRKKSPKPKGPPHTDSSKIDDMSATKSPAANPVKLVSTATEAEVPKNIPVPAAATGITCDTKTSLKDVAIPLGFEIPKPIEPTQTKILETPEIDKVPEMPTNIMTSDAEEPKPDKIQMPDINTGKKRKKSPKPKQPERQEAETKIEKEKSPMISETFGTFQEPPKNISREQTEKKDLPLDEFEIRSIKTDESEGSVCDIVPDVHYPRASSQLLDNNNNMTIQEVFPDIKLNIEVTSVDTPIVQGSGETPSSAPELIPLDISFSEMAISTTKPEPGTSKADDKETKPFKSDEKTNLKSRVLDVNQGMEELRKSIERSLAEFSAMEKSEKDAEEQFAKAQEKLEEIKEMAGKKSGDAKKEVSKTEQIKITETKEKKSEEVKKEVAKVENIQAKEPIMPKSGKDIIISSPKTEQSVTKSDEPKMQLFEPSKITAVIKQETKTPIEATITTDTPIPPPPVIPARKDNKGKGKKKKGRHDSDQSATPIVTESGAATVSSTSQDSTSISSEAKDKSQDTKKEEKAEQKTETQEKGKQQAGATEDDVIIQDSSSAFGNNDFIPIESFEDALTSSTDDVNKNFEMIVNDGNQVDQSQNPEINVTAPTEDDDKDERKDPKDEKVNPVSQPKNLLGHPDIPVRLNKTDYKKEKNKTPNTRQAKVKIKDAVPIEVTKETKECQTENNRRFLKDKTASASITSVTNTDEQYVYKYSFRKVFLPSACHVCKKDLKQIRVPCNYCNLVFYCSAKHKDEDYAQHQALCFAVSTIVHLKDQKHLYAEAANITGYEYRLLRMQMIVSCEKVLKRRLVPWEQEALLYPRICADASCREWRQDKLMDCEGCGQISYCSEHPTHLPKSHQRWCKSYSLYHRLVVYQQTRGRMDPKLPTRVIAELTPVAETLNEVLADLYEEKIDMTDIQYAAVTQIATAPLTAVYCQQIYTTKMNSTCANGVLKKSSFTIHIVGAELQFEADSLNKWEVFFLHLRPDIKDLRVVMIGPELNPSKLPLDLLGKIKLCENCRLNKRRVLFDFQDNKTYYDYWATEFTTPDMVCAFNPSIQRSSIFNGKDIWPSTIKCIMKLKVPFLVTAHTITELERDINRIKECSDINMNTISEPKFNAFASVRPDRNFISDDEMPLLFKNFCFAVLCGSF